MENNKRYQVVEVVVSGNVKRIVKCMTIFNEITKANYEVDRLRKLYPKKSFEIRVI